MHCERYTYFILAFDTSTKYVYNRFEVILIKRTNLSETDIFFINLKKVGISKEDEEILYDLVVNLENRTNIQKTRFLLYYNLFPKQKEKYNFSSLATKCKCSSPAIRFSISRIRNGLTNLKGDKKNIFLKLVKNNI